MSFLSKLLIFIVSVFAFNQNISFAQNNIAIEDSAVIVCDNSIEMMEMLVESVSKANQCIEICPCMGGGKVLCRLLTTAYNRMEQVNELKFYLLLNPVFLDANDYAHIEGLKKRFPERFNYVLSDFAPVNFPLANVIELHSKISVIDGKYYFVGGTNYEDYMCTVGDSEPYLDPEDPRYNEFYIGRPVAFRDQDVVGRSFAVCDSLRREFHRLYRSWEHYASHKVLKKDLSAFESSWNYKVLDRELACNVDAIDHKDDLIAVPDVNVRCIFSGPYQRVNLINEEYKRCLRESSNSVSIAALYFLPCDELNDEIKKVVQKGVKLDVFTNGKHDTSPSCVDFYCWGNRINYMPLMLKQHFYLWEKKKASRTQENNHVGIYEYAIKDSQLHKKVMIADDNFIIGSFNLCGKSLSLDYETIISYSSKDVANAARKVLEKDKTLCNKISKDQEIRWYFDGSKYLLGYAQLKFMPA